MEAYKVVYFLIVMLIVIVLYGIFKNILLPELKEIWKESRGEKLR